MTVRPEHEGQAGAGQRRPHHVVAAGCGRRRPAPSSGCPCDEGREPRAPVGAALDRDHGAGRRVRRTARPLGARPCGAPCTHERLDGLVVVDGADQHGGRLERVEPGVVQRSAAGRTSSTSTPSTCWISLDEQRRRARRRAARRPARRWPAGAPLEDVDADHVAADGADAAGDRPERARPVRQPHPDDVGRRHGRRTVRTAA